MTLIFKYFDTRLNQWLHTDADTSNPDSILTEELDNTLLEFFFPDKQFSFGQMDEHTKAEDLKNHPDGQILLLSSKTPLLYGSQECLEVIEMCQPAHSPELNPIERVWEFIKRQLQGEVFTNLQELRDRLQQVLEKITPEQICSLSSYNFILEALVDINLPDIDCAELCKRIKDNFHTKVIILTADNTQDTVTKAFRYGADSYCVKNLPRKKLAEAVYATYRGESWIDSTIGKIVIENMKDSTKSIRKIQKIHNKRESAYGASILSQREIDVLRLIAQGMSNEKISGNLYISIGTVRSHVHRILQKLNCESRSQAAIKAISEGLVETLTSNQHILLKFLKPSSNTRFDHNVGFFAL